MNTSQDPPGATGSLWRNGQLASLLVVVFAGFTSFGLTLAALPQWAALGGAGVALVGVVTTAMLTATVLVQVVVPFLTTRIRGDWLLAIGLLLLGLPAPLYVLSNDVLWLVAVSLFRGAGFGILTVLGASLAVNIAPPNRRGQVVGFYGVAIAIPTTVGVPVALTWTLEGNFAWAAFGAIAPALVAWLALRLRPAFSQTAATAVGSARLMAHGRDVVAALGPSLVMFAVTFAGAGFLTFLPLSSNVGDRVVHAIWVFSLAGAAARFGAGFLADRWGSKHLLFVSTVLAGVGLAIVAVDLSGSEFGWPGLLGAVLFGVGYGAVQNLALLEAVARTVNNEVASSVWNIGYDAGTATGAWVVGLIAATVAGVSGGLGVAAVGLLGCAWVSLVRRREAVRSG